MDTEWIIAGGTAIVLGAGGGLLTEIGAWYRNLKKPWWNPPNWLFGPAWTLLLIGWAWSAVTAWRAADAATQPWVLILYGLNAALFFAWSPLFFKLKRPDWALLEIIPFWASILALILFTAPFAPKAAWLIAPYLAWVSFAAVLNWKIVQLNKPFAR
ncbi:TspO/MBR family protein [Sandaracinobacteroides saxicola]|uniref:Tryptophan-rich sensory protein n=1 Tax=Sandaracinobacteroides saxicola TaxID=2759707 RepID=A0A7G5IE79_9SPHN|nr:TspO/MBR family protein [Sandaracinobacteroides saxicola]QMW21671.1 tryptophan-rich sensory protein [Sandaracinobacteroides saxicola]